MTRIIAGAARSQRLEVPKRGTRPTSDRVREALFSALDSSDSVTDARVLDLFAGTGALGLEAGSRGAARVVFVEKNAEACRVLRSNVASVAKLLGAHTQLTVQQSSVAAALAALTTQAAGFDLVFLDPPYDFDDAELSHTLNAVAEVCLPGATIVVERSSRDSPPNWPASLRATSQKKYGETALYFAEHSE